MTLKRKIEKLTAIGIMTALVAGVILTTPVFANEGVPSSITDLESSFEGFEDFLNDLVAEIDQNTLNIIQLLGNQTTNFQHLLDHHDLLDAEELEVDDIDSRLLTVEVAPTSVISFSSYNRNGLGVSNGDIFLGYERICGGVPDIQHCFFLVGRIIPLSGTLSDLMVKTDGFVNNDYNFTVYKNAVETSLSCIITSGGSTECSNTSSPITVQSGDIINVANNFISVAGDIDDRLVRVSISLNP